MNAFGRSRFNHPFTVLASHIRHVIHFMFMDAKCKNCEKWMLPADVDINPDICQVCLRDNPDLDANKIKKQAADLEKKEAEEKKKADKDAQNFEKKLNSIIVTTAFTVANKDIDHEIGIVTGECVLGMNIFLDVFAEFTDTFGGRSKKTQSRLRELKDKCLEEIKIEAVDLGADAIIGLDLDYSEFSGKGKSMLFLVASGTAVKLKN